MSGSQIKSLLLGTAVVAGLASSGQAALTASYNAAFVAGTTTFPTPPAPTIVTTNNTNTNTTAPPAGSSAFTSDAGAAVGTGVGQTFTVDATTAGTLDKIVFVARTDAATVTSLTFNLFAVTGTVAGGGAGTDGKGTSQGGTISTTNLLGGGSGLTFTGLGTTYGLETLDLTGTDEITLTPGTYYAEIFNNAGNTGNVDIARQGSVDTVYNNGNAYTRTLSNPTSLGTVFGGGTRDAAIAVYTAVPEPGSLATLALGGIALIRRRRA